MKITIEGRPAPDRRGHPAADEDCQTMSRNLEFWTLDADHNPVRTSDILQWGRFFNDPDRVVGKTDVGRVRVSTVFLGIDHGRGWMIGEEGPPVLFETMIFGGKHDQYQDRYCTWAEAEAGHARAVKLVRGDWREWPMRAWNAILDAVIWALDR
jgi:hypothetical protein